MKVYLLERLDSIGWDEVDAMVIVAECKRGALKIASEQDWGDWDFDITKLDVKHIDLSKSESKVILSSFNAG